MKQKSVKASKLNDGHYLEILDRIHCQITDIEHHLLEHPVSEDYDELRELIIKSISNLIKAYQVAGRLASASKLKKKKK